MTDEREIIKGLTGGVSVSGYEMGIESVVSAIGEKYFDEYRCDSVGNYYLIKHAKKADYKKILIDAHIDEVGMIVTEILDGGFLRVSEVGGIDVAVLPASEVTIHGKKEIYGVVCSTPPHLAKGDRLVLPKLYDVLVDTGYSKEYLESVVTIGTPITFKHVYTELLNDKICTKSLDNKICALAAVKAAILLSQTDFDDELTVLFSVKEEVSRAVVTAVYSVEPDFAVVLDVCNSKIPDSDKKENVVLGGGCNISISPVTAPKLSKKLVKCAKRCGIPHSVAVEAQGTGTNANDIPLVKNGVPTVLLSVPLRSMHTPSEVISFKDVEYTAQLVKEFLLEMTGEGGEKRE